MMSSSKKTGSVWPALSMPPPPAKEEFGLDGPSPVLVPLVSISQGERALCSMEMPETPSHHIPTLKPKYKAEFKPSGQ
eukprot:tig00000823_g4559.t1